MTDEEKKQKQKEYAKRYYEQHKDKYIENAKAWRNGKGREKYLESKRAYQQTPEYKEYQRQYYQKRKNEPGFKEAKQEYYRKWVCSKNN